MQTDSNNARGGGIAGGGSGTGGTKKVTEDMTTRIGGRIVRPALPVVDASPPTTLETSFHTSLQKFISDNVPLESTEGIQRRERVLNRMGTLVRQWIRSVCLKRGLPKEVVDMAGGQLYTSGSYRLGVHEPGADIDTILVAPNVCTKQDFFGTIPTVDGTNPDDAVSSLRDPESLAERIRAHPDVTNFVPVEGAAVPILTFDWEGVNIDLLFARLNSASVPADFDIDNDAVLDGVDSATEKSLNGPRVTNLIAALVSGTPQRYQTFLTVVRCVRKWAKARGLYSNKMGYWGGVNINIAVALCVQLYPNAAPASLLRKFFLVFRTWRWPNPVMLTKPHDAGFGLQVWSPQAHHNARQVAPIITPAYPAMNSTLAVSRQTLQIMHEEFCRGHEILDRLWKEHQAKSSSSRRPGTTDDVAGENDLNWEELFRPSDFFIAYPNYLSLCIVGPTQADAQAWAGFVESRLRKLVSDMLGRSLPLSKIQLWPKKIEACIADRSSLLTMGQRKNSITYMVGFQVDTLRMRGRQLNVELQMAHFREWELSRFQPLVPGMDVLVKSFVCKNLPKICFEIYGDEGKEGAMKRRRMLRDADPKRQERKRLKRLNELKAKMAEIQKRKEEQQQQKLQEQQQQEESAKVKKEGEDDNNKEEEKKGKVEDGGGGDDDDDLFGDGDDDNAAGRKRKRSNSQSDDHDHGNEQALSKTRFEEEQAAGAADDNNEAVEETEEEANLLESALDTLQVSEETGGGKTREEAEADRRKLLAGEYGLNDDDDDDGQLLPPPSDDEEEMIYTGDGARDAYMVVQPKKAPSSQFASADGLINTAMGIDGSTSNNHGGTKYRDIRALPMKREQVELLRKIGYNVVSDNEQQHQQQHYLSQERVLGGNMLTPFRRKYTAGGGTKKSTSENGNDNLNGDDDDISSSDDDDDDDDDDEQRRNKKMMMKKKRTAMKRKNNTNMQNAANINRQLTIEFLTSFDIVELDANGHVIDKGDDDFTPSKTWIGRKAGFEFKLGERGLGYYRTGKRVVVPSNTAY